jgi:alanine-synthesizing transaminase
MGNPDGATPKPIISKLIEAARNPRNTGIRSREYSQLAAGDRQTVQGALRVSLDPEKEAIVTIGAKTRWHTFCSPSSARRHGGLPHNPAYPIHQYGVVMAEGHAAALPMPTPEEFLNRLEDLYRTALMKPRMILISFPHNPTTLCVEREFFRGDRPPGVPPPAPWWCTICIRDLGFDGYRAPSILEIDGAKEVAVEIYSMSKSFNMAGWRIGFCLVIAR